MHGRIDATALLRFARATSNAAAAGAMGYWLEREKARLGIPDSIISDLRALAPSQSRYALGARPAAGRLAKGWNVILPTEIIERAFEGL